MLKNKNVRPKGFYWFIYVTLARIIGKIRFNLTWDNKEFRKRNKKEGCIVLYNHRSMNDHIMQTAALGYDPGNFVVTNRFMYDPMKNWCFTQVRAITRDQFRQDTASILKMKHVLKQNGYFILSPSGQTSACGAEAYINPVVSKLFKMFKVDVYATHIYGNYLTTPKWRNIDKKIPIHVSIEKIITKEDVSSLSEEELYSLMVKKLDIRDYDYQEKNHYEIKGDNLAEGFNSIYFRCPSCKEKYTMNIIDGSIIKCSKCSYTVKYNKYGNLESVDNKPLTFKHEPDWYYFENKLAFEEVLDKDFKLDIKCDLYHHKSNPKIVQKEGEGILHIDINKIYYEGTLLDDTKYHKDFEVDQILQIPYTANSHFNIPDAEGIFEFYPEDHIKVCEYVLFLHGIAAHYHPELYNALTSDILCKLK